MFPADNWWNADISAAPVDAGSAGYIAFINNGGTRRLHPDFGGRGVGRAVDSALRGFRFFGLQPCGRPLGGVGRPALTTGAGAAVAPSSRGETWT